jgi:type IV pilus assembly protein PilN
MIKINLLSAERKSVKKKLPFDLSQKLTLACGLILVGAVLLVGWRYWSLNREATRLTTGIASAEKELEGLRSTIAQVQQYEQRKTVIQQRVALIEKLRKEQTGPVHMLDQISRSMPSMLWLTDLKQTLIADEVIIAGRCTTLTGLSDFVANLEQSGYFKRSVEIVSSTAEAAAATTPGELIKFEIKAVFQQPGHPAVVPPAVASANRSE